MNLKKIGAGVVISTLSFGVSAETLELAIGETRTIDSAASYAEGLSVSVAPETHIHEAYLTGSNTLVLPGAKLADYEFYSAGLRCKASSWGPGGTDLVTNVAPMFVTRTADSLVAQFQYYAGDVWPRVRGAKVEMTETAEGLVARIAYVRYVNDWISVADGLAGVDFDSTTHGVLTPNLATSDDGVAIGIKTLTLRKLKTAPGRLVFTEPVDFGTGLVVGDNAIVELQGEAVRSPLAALSGAGDLVLGSFDEHIEPEVTAVCPVRVMDTATVLATGPDYRLADLTGLRAVMRSADGPEGTVCFFENDGEKATCQIQSVKGDYNRCAFLELTQVGSSIVGRITAAYYGFGSAPVGTDFRIAPSTSYGVQDLAWAVNANNANAEGIVSMTLVFSNVTIGAKVALPALEDFSGSVTVKEGVTLEAGTDKPLPTGGLTLEGGRLLVESSVACGPLTLAADSTLSLAEEASVAFADSSAMTWLEEAKLTVGGAFADNDSLRFGTSSAALTKAQREAFDIRGRTAKLSDAGWLARMSGLILVFR